MKITFKVRDLVPTTLGSLLRIPPKLRLASRGVEARPPIGPIGEEMAGKSICNQQLDKETLR